MANEVVRRLTPLECERLQGFPDNWTKTNHNLCVDSTRFRIIGNSIAIPCADYVFARMIKYGFEKSQEFP
ncbi:MAG: DNA cytosine methyltransferase [Selenomonadaceae bacterium]|nr:DNA cytosine methyltransferase [Selenomonadaceae bacterium]MBR3721656.1 DNA cytosine methyltransferase [Selenomonadaceae bacterium]